VNALGARVEVTVRSVDEPADLLDEIP